MRRLIKKFLKMFAKTKVKKQLIILDYIIL